MNVLSFCMLSPLGSVADMGKQRDLEKKHNTRLNSPSVSQSYKNTSSGVLNLSEGYCS